MPVRTDVGVDALGNYLIVDGIVARDHTVGEILVGRVNARVQHGNAHDVQRTESCFIAHFTHELKKRSGHLRLAHIGVGRHRSEVLGNARRRQRIVVGDRLDVRHFFIAHSFRVGTVYQQHVAAECPPTVYCPEYLKRACT